MAHNNKECGNVTLEVTKREWDLGVMVSSDLRQKKTVLHLLTRVGISYKKISFQSVSVFRASVQYQSQLMAISYHESTSMWSHQKCRRRKIFFDRCRAGLNRIKTVFSQSHKIIFKYSSIKDEVWMLIQKIIQLTV
ncbi:hypothetical protein BpHYR1_025759 [Brachionus plicatilis]|uniref:Uncharacterized protein n=1 Tax=Brachionus plicatilis TaxID=10195 RepID=A0A3M7RZW8_BRAPC|nr:hypothetical protein BpHYR1_025759 [Brachionus plicatilis]